MSYPKAVYQSGEEVLLGDHVKFKTFVEFWRGWIDGRIMFVPGISPSNASLEDDGLKWVSIDYDNTKVAPLVHPETGIIKKVKLVRRSDGDIKVTPNEYEFPDDYADNENKTEPQR